MMKTCSLPFLEIVNYYEGRSDASAQQRVRRHLADGCESCRARLTWMQQYLPALHSALTEDAVSAPEAALALARRIVRDRLPAPAPVPLRQRIAQLLFDSLRPLSPATARRSAGPEVQKLYATENCYVEVWIEPMQEGGCYLIGQMVSRSDSTPLRPQSAALIRQDGSRTPARLEGNEFHFASVAQGIYQIGISLGEEEILLPEVLVGETGTPL